MIPRDNICYVSDVDLASKIFDNSFSVHEKCGTFMHCKQEVQHVVNGEILTVKYCEADMIWYLLILFVFCACIYMFMKFRNNN